ncbi:MAG: DUF4097 domain-containing protein [Gemmatimonadota bacterium]|nr:DUF4097 domain-containing protein [Gemmatimonadota bacterium]
MTARSRGLVTAVVAIALPFGIARAQQKVQVGRAVTSTASIRLFAAVGEITVIGWDRDSVELTGTVQSGSRVETAGGSYGEKAKGMKMFIEAPPEQSGREGKLVLRIPRGARLWLKTGSADLDITGVTGGLDLNVVGGSITVHGNPKELRAESMDGNVTIDGTPEWLRTKTATGDITLRGGQDVGASTISGTIRSSGGEVERAKYESTTGAISFSSSLARGASVELETHSGPVDILFVGRNSIELDAATITGTITNGWTNTRPTKGSEGRGMTLVTANGMGGSRMVVRTFKGAVQVRGK